MKKLIALSALATLALASNSQAGFIGPLPKADAKTAKTVSAGYFFSQADWETDSGAAAADAELSQNQFYAQIDYRLTKRFEVFARAGASNFEADNGIIGQADFDGSDYRAFGGIGLNSLIRDGEMFDIGFFAQGHYFANYTDRAVISTTAGNVSVKQEISSPWDASAGLVIQGEVDGGIVYGGPLVYVAQAELERVGSGAASFSDSPEFEESGIAGAFIGLSWEPTDDLTVDIEAQFKSSVSGGIAFNWAF